MTNRYKELFKNTGILTISQFSSKILIFLLVPLYTSVLSTEEYGIYDLMVTTVNFLYPILTVNIIEGVMRFLMDEESDKKNVISVGIKYITIGIVLALAIAIPLYIFNCFKNIRPYIPLTLCYYVTFLLSQFGLQVAKGFNKVKIMGIAGIIGTSCVILFNLLFLLVFKLGIHGFFYANILGHLIPAIYLMCSLRIWIYISKISDKHNAKEILMYSAPLLSNTLAWIFNSYADKYVVTLMIGVAANGLLSISYKIPTILNTFQSIFNQAWQISAVKEYSKGDSGAFFEQVLISMNIVMCLGCSLLICLTKNLAGFLYSKDFYEAWRYVPFLIVSCVINASAGIIGAMLSAKKDSKTMAIAGVIGAFSNIILNIVFIGFIGIQGAAVATVISSFIIFYIRMRAIVNEINVNCFILIIFTWLLLSIQSVIKINISSLYSYISDCVIFFVIVIVYLKPIIKYKDLLLKMIRRKR